MEKHPEGIEATRHLVSKAGLDNEGKVCKILDMGCGDGDTVRFLSGNGYEAVGIDIELPDSLNTVNQFGTENYSESIKFAENEGVIAYIKGNFLKSGLDNESFDAIISQCSFFISGDMEGAYREAYRLLKPGGKLLVSDVKFDNTDNPEDIAGNCGFEITYISDDTKAWQHFYIQSIWDGEDCGLCGFFPAKELGKCRYYSMICRKPL